MEDEGRRREGEVRLERQGTADYTVETRLEDGLEGYYSGNGYLEAELPLF